jgi:hypothetical protein
MCVRARDQVVCDAVCARYPPSFAFRKRFLKALLDYVQEQDEVRAHTHTPAWPI